MTARVASLPMLLAALIKGADAAFCLAAPGSKIAARLADVRAGLADALDEMDRVEERAEADRRAREARGAFRVVGDGDVRDWD